MRQSGFPIGIEPYEVLGPLFPASIRRILDVPAFWLVLLLAEFPAIVIAGAIALARSVGAEPDQRHRGMAAIFAALALASLVVTWLVTSRLGEHNDLGWRAVLPAVFVVMVFAAIGLTHWIARRAYVAAGAALVGLLIALPDGIKLIATNGDGPPGAFSTRIRASAGTLGGGARTNRTRRARCQQSALSRRHHAVARQYFLGVAGEPQVLFCGSRADPRLRAAPGCAARGDQCAIHPRFCRPGLGRRRPRPREDLSLPRDRAHAIGWRLEQ